MIVPVAIVSAHPHTWITAALEVRATGHQIDGLHIRWDFDSGFTSMITTDIKPGANRQFTPTNINRLYKEAFSNLKQYGYFTRLFWGKEELKGFQILNFTGYLNAKRNLVYEFDIPIGRPVPTAGIDLGIMQFDPTFFVDVAQIDLPKIVSDAELTSLARTVDVPSMAVMGLFVPQRTTITLKPK